MKILFAASGEIALPTLEALYENGLLVAVLTSPDKRGKRGSTLLPSPIKKRALELGVKVYTFESLKKEAREEISKIDVDTLVSFCYGKIFGPKFLSLFDRTFNIHPSLLPKYRGCAPLKETILNQDRECGISIQEIALACDEGDIYKTTSFELSGCESEEELTQKVSIKASELARELFLNIERYEKYPQVGEVSWSYMTNKEDARLSLDDDVKTIHAKIRAYYPWPKAYLLYNDQMLYLTGVSGSVFDIKEEVCKEEIGTCVSLEKGKGLKIALKGGYLYVSSLQLPTKKELKADSFVNGNKSIIGAKLS